MILSQISRKLPIITVSIAIIASLSFFRTSLNILLNKVFVIPLISEFEDTIFNSLALVLLSGSILLWLTIYGSKMFVRQIGIIVLGFYILMATSKFWILRDFPSIVEWILFKSFKKECGTIEFGYDGLFSLSFCLTQTEYEENEE